MKKYLHCLLAVLTVHVLYASCATADDGMYRNDRNDSRASLSTTKRSDVEATIMDSRSVYKMLVRDNRIPASVQRDAKCIAIFPRVVTAALGVGGLHGDGVAMCRKTAGTGWTNPVFLSINGGSLGVQAGVKSSDLVLYMTGDNSRSLIEQGKFRLSGDIGVVAGSFDQSFSVPASGVVAYANTQGAFVGASVSGTDISQDRSAQQEFYGTSNTTNGFENKTPSSEQKIVNELQEALPT